jgi:GTP-binding protein
MKLPLVAVVGRPNVGKSTLFNRITHSRRAITSPEPGVTRDRHVAEADTPKRKFLLMDTGGWVPKSDDVFESAIREQVQFALEECDLVLFVTDAHTGPTDMDLEIARMLQRSPLPVLLAVNKVDGPKQDAEPPMFYAFGLGDPIPVSAAGGRGVADLVDLIIERLPEVGTKDELSRPHPLVAVVGRPNVGKSSFVNAIVGKPLRIVTDVAGTTRDALDTVITYYDQRMTLIDTAGLRRRTKVEEAVEFYTTVRTKRALEECDVAVVLADSRDEVVAQDLRILQEAAELGKGVILCMNKWDLVTTKTDKTSDRFVKDLNARYPSMDYIPKVFISSLEKQRVFRTLELVLKVYEERQKRISTPELNRFLVTLMDVNPPPTVNGRDMRIHYVTQPTAEPPLFAFWLRYPDLLNDTYKRYLERKFREQYGFEGVPIRLVFRKKT